jgi:hypothetical protein
MTERYADSSRSRTHASSRNWSSARRQPANSLRTGRYRRPIATNTPRTLERHLGPFVEDGTLERFPYGTELTDIELTLARALREFQSTVEKRDPRELLDRESLETVVRLPAAADPYLERLNLASARGLRERLLRRAVVLALARHGEL